MAPFFLSDDCLAWDKIWDTFPTSPFLQQWPIGKHSKTSTTTRIMTPIGRIIRRGIGIMLEISAETITTIIVRIRNGHTMRMGEKRFFYCIILRGFRGSLSLVEIYEMFVTILRIRQLNSKNWRWAGKKTPRWWIWHRSRWYLVTKHSGALLFWK